MSALASSLLASLEEVHATYGRGRAVQKLEILRQLDAERLGSAHQVLALHEVLCFLCAYPDNREVLKQTERMLAAFSGRSDLRRHHAQLADTGIAGTRIRYRFYWEIARWLARRWPDHLRVEWAEFENQARLPEILHLLLPYSETVAVDALDLTPRGWISMLKSSEESDAAFLIRRFERLQADAAVREHLFEQLDVPLILEPGPDTPSRTGARFGGLPIRFQRRPLAGRRPDLKREIRRPPRSFQALGSRRAQAAIDLARSSMVTRSRDLYAFASADPGDARLVTFERGLAFVVLGLRPEHRLLLETSYGVVMVKNQIPIGYALASSLFGSTEVAFNMFETFRGAEAAQVFARLLAMMRRLFGSDAFAIDPYQLGAGNDEGLRSGAWWFYYKLGFRSHDPDVRRTLQMELSRMKADPRHRSTLPTLRRLAADYLFLYLDRPRKGVLGRVFLGNVGARLSEYLARRFGADRETGIKRCSSEAAELLGTEGLERLSPGERLAWSRWAPLVLILPGITNWSTPEKRALIRVIRAKGRRRESEYLALCNRHPRLRRALLRLAR